MNLFVQRLETIGRFVFNKAIAILLTLFLLDVYHHLPAGEIDKDTGLVSGGTPFAELIYLAILILGSTVVAPFVRLLVFSEAADYAESGKLARDIATPGVTPGLIHYWFATGVSYLLTIACAATLSH